MYNSLIVYLGNFLRKRHHGVGILVMVVVVPPKFGGKNAKLPESDVIVCITNAAFSGTMKHLIHLDKYLHEEK